MKIVGVVGGGQMGSGIAQVTAEAGYAVRVREVDQGLLDRSLHTVEQSWARAVARGTLSGEARAGAAAKLRGTLDLRDLQECDLIIEAIIENREAKRRLFAELDAVCPPATVLASNTSAIPILEMAMATRRPARVCGLHFFNPVPAMKLVEVVQTLHSSPAVVAEAVEFVRSLGKEPVLTRDTAGFLVNRLLLPYLLDAVRAVESGVGSVADIDRAMRLGCGHPMGPLTLLDFIGLETAAAVAEVLYAEYREPRYAPPPLLVGMVRAGFYGRKSGRGFYDYSEATPRPVPLPV